MFLLVAEKFKEKSVILITEFWDVSTFLRHYFVLFFLCLRKQNDFILPCCKSLKCHHVEKKSTLVFRNLMRLSKAILKGFLQRYSTALVIILVPLLKLNIC